MSDTTPSAVDKYTSMQVMQSFPAYALWVKFTDYAALSAQLEAAHQLYRKLPSGSRDDAVAMQFLIPGWKFDPKRPALNR